MPSAIEVGRRIQSLRKKENLSQQKLADDLGVSVSTITMYENGMRTPRDEVKVKIAKRFNLTVEQIFFTEQCHY